MRYFALLVATSMVHLLVDAPASASPTTVASDKPRTVELCSADGSLNTKRVRALRDAINGTGNSSEQLQELATVLKEGTTHCLSPMASGDTSFLAGLYVVLGDRFLADKEFARAREGLSTATAMFERLNLPNFMWLRALELAAQAEIGSHNLERAREVATDETNLARSWVSSSGFDQSALVRALRFQARVCTLQHLSERAAELTLEADRLESGKP
jgi:hypothetical protein